MAEFLEPKEIKILDMKGKERSYIISKFPAIAGREIIAKYPLSAIPKLSDYEANEAVMLRLMEYVGVTLQTGVVQSFSTRILIDNHVPDWETLVKIELEMMRYNTSFFGHGEISTFLKGIIQKLPAWISPTLTPLLQQLLEAVKLRLKNSNLNTP